MNNESMLLSKVIQERNLSILLESGVTEEWFRDPDEKKVFKFLASHFANYRECPSQDVVLANFPSYQIHQPSDAIEYFLDRMVENRRKMLIVQTLGKSLGALEADGDHEGALLEMERGIVLLEESGLTRTNDVEVTQAAQRAKDEYEHRKQNPGLLGMPTGFPTIDASTSGLQPGQLIVVVAPPKTGKSTLALQIAINGQMQGKVPLFISFEMSNQEQLNRYYAMRARISYRRLMTGSLTQDEEARFYAKVASIVSNGDKFHFIDSTTGQTVSAIASKIQSKDPDIVFIDGTYLMIDEQTGEANTPQALTNITRSLKRLAQKVNKPIVITTQVLTWKQKKGQVTADAIGYSSSFHQDADVIFGLQREDENVDDTRLLRVIASRNSSLESVTLQWDWATATFREMDESDL